MMALQCEYSPRKDSSLLTPLYSLTKSELIKNESELVENKSELIEIVSKVRGERSEEREERNPCGVGSAPKGQ